MQVLLEGEGGRKRRDPHGARPSGAFPMRTPPDRFRAKEREREREREAPLALRATRPHTVGYIRVCDQEEGAVQCFCRQRLGDIAMARGLTVFCYSLSPRLITPAESAECLYIQRQRRQRHGAQPPGALCRDARSATVPRQSGGGGKFVQKRLSRRSPLLKTTVLRAKLTFDDPLLDSGVIREGKRFQPQLRHGKRALLALDMMEAGAAILQIYNPFEIIYVMFVPESGANRSVFNQERRFQATWKREFKLPWREASPPNYLDDKVDSDQ